MFTKAAIFFSCVAIGTAVIPAIAGSSAVARPFNTGAYSDSVSGGPVLGVDNTNTTNPFNDYGVEGKVSGDVGGVGILGYGQQAKSYGVYGVSFGSNGIGLYGAGDGPTPAPGATPNAAMQSTGVVGDSHSGYGVYGSTEFSGASTPAKAGNLVSGIFGVDLATKVTDNIGVAGVTTSGAYGVGGFAGDAAQGGVYGTATKGFGVAGVATGGPGVLGTSQAGAGGLFTSAEYDGVDATPGSMSGAAGFAATGTTNTYAFDGTDPDGIAIRAQTTSGTAVYATTSTGTAMSVGGGTGYGIEVGSSGGTGIQVINSAGHGIYSAGTDFGVISAAASSGEPFIGINSNSSGVVFEVTSAGNVKYSGTLGAESRTRSGRSAESFSARSSAPTIEDTGSAQLVAGRAAVAIDPAVVEQMDLTSTYRVFLTPDGDTNGLYVESKSPRGFVVREIHGGHASLAFDYRIVAAVDGQAQRRTSISSEPRMAAVPRTAAAPLRLPVAPEHHAPNLSSTRLARIGANGLMPRFYVPQPNVSVEHRVPLR